MRRRLSAGANRTSALSGAIGYSRAESRRGACLLCDPSSIPTHDSTRSNQPGASHASNCGYYHPRVLASSAVT
jgi:hypothetical protein